MNSTLWRGVGNGAASGALWGLVFLSPLILHDFSPLQLAAARYLVYGVVAAALLAPRWRHMGRRLGGVEWRALVWLSLAGNLLYYVLLASAVQWAGHAATSLIVGLLPVVVTLVGARDHGAVRLHRLAAPLLLCLAGVLLVGREALQNLGGLDPGANSGALGLLCATGALLSWSAYSVGNSRWLARRPDLSAHDWSLLTGVVTGVGALLLAVPAFSQAAEPVHSPGAWWRFWGVSTVIAVLASVVGNACWNRASRLLPLTLTGQMIVFETLFALVYGFVWAQRWPTAFEWAAMGCLLGGVWWCMKVHRPRVDPTPP